MKQKKKRGKRKGVLRFFFLDLCVQTKKKKQNKHNHFFLKKEREKN